MSAERMASQIAEDATIAQKAAEIGLIAVELQDAMAALYNADSNPTIYPVFKRVMWSIECLAEEIQHTALAAERSAETTQPVEKTGKRAIGSTVQEQPKSAGGAGTKKKGAN